MANDSTWVIDLQMDVNNVFADVEEITDVFNGLKESIDKIGISALKALSPMKGYLKGLHIEIESIKASISELGSELASISVASKSSNDGGNFFDSIISGYDSLSGFLKGMENVDKTSGRLLNVFEELVTAPNMANLLQSMFPETSSIFGTVSQWIDDNVINAAAVALGNGKSVIGVGVSEMITSMSDTFKGIGSALGGMSVGWGAAITGIIALILLLVTNWDTVKAAVLSAWEAIKGALATAADWFNTNVLQPLVGFFQDAMAWIGEKVQAGIAFVQAIFAGIGAFLQGAFAKDWTEHKKENTAEQRYIICRAELYSFLFYKVELFWDIVAGRVW